MPRLSPLAPDLRPQARVPLPPTQGGCTSCLTRGDATFMTWRFPGWSPAGWSQPLTPDLRPPSGPRPCFLSPSLWCGSGRASPPCTASSCLEAGVAMATERRRLPLVVRGKGEAAPGDRKSVLSPRGVGLCWARRLRSPARPRWPPRPGPQGAAASGARGSGRPACGGPSQPPPMAPLPLVPPLEPWTLGLGTAGLTPPAGAPDRPLRAPQPRPGWAPHTPGPPAP